MATRAETSEEGAKRPSPKTPVQAPEGAKLLTVPETAFELRCSVDVVYRLINRGEIASTAVASKRFVTRQAVAEYLSRQTTTRTAETVAPAAASVKLRASGLWNGKDY